VADRRAHSGELDLAAARPGAYNVINADGSAPSWYANFAADSARGQGG
jgi:hypothetical protein